MGFSITALWCTNFVLRIFHGYTLQAYQYSIHRLCPRKRERVFKKWNFRFLDQTMDKTIAHYRTRDKKSYLLSAILDMMDGMGTHFTASFISESGILSGLVAFFGSRSLQTLQTRIFVLRYGLPCFWGILPEECPIPKFSLKRLCFSPHPDTRFP